MLKQMEGSRAVAEAVALSRPQVICAYPITPQTHIVEALGALVKKVELNAGFLNVESEFAAMSAVIGASAAGARTYTATASLIPAKVVLGRNSLPFAPAAKYATPSSALSPRIYKTAPSGPGRAWTSTSPA